MNIEQIEIEKLIVSKLNVRSDAHETIRDSDTSIQDLAQSIQTQGLINPISVRPSDNGLFEIYAGQRRYLAIKSLGWPTVTCAVAPTTMTDNQAKTGSLVENFQRQENSYRDKVEAFSALLENPCNGDLAKLCKLVGVSDRTAKSYVKMSQLPNDVLKHMDANADGKRLTVSAATALVALPGYQQTATSSLLVGKSVSDSAVIFKRLKDLPELADEEEILLQANNALEDHALKVAEDANLVRPYTWKSDSPWLPHPTDANRCYRIDNSHDVWSTLLGLGALTRVDVTTGKPTTASPIRQKRPVQSNREVETPPSFVSACTTGSVAGSTHCLEATTSPVKRKVQRIDLSDSDSE